MTSSSSLKVILGLLVLGAASAQASTQTTPAQPYAGLQNREIKSLSREQMDQLVRGEGAGLALAAELNGYPGPRHVLDLAPQLGLSDDQRSHIRQLFASMKSDAVPIGQQLIAAERDLNRAFVERTITAEKLEAATAAIGEIQGRLRDTHLKYHLATAALLSSDQIRRYAELRGYAALSPAAGPGAGPASPSSRPTGGADTPAHSGSMHHQ